MKEWKQFRRTDYSVSSDGDMRNDRTGKLLRTNITRSRYRRITIWDGSKPFTIAIHRIVAEAFLGEAPFVNAVVNHLDGNPSNNAVSNLEWATISQNVKHAYDTGLAARGADSVHAKLSEEDVKTIKRLLSDNTVRALAAKFGVSDATISHIRNGDTWAHILPELNTQLADKEKYHKYKLKASDIPNIRESFRAGLDDNEIAANYGVHRASIYNIRVGKNWKNY